MNRPPVTLKNGHADVRRLRPIEREMYMTLSTERPSSPWLPASYADAWTPPYASVRKVVVPMNSMNVA